jgi:5-methylcytosine-specific restriction endonuclease McrA
MSIGRSKRFRVLLRDGFTCRYCGRGAPSVVLEIDHVIPRRMGGRDVEQNLVTSCFDCNRGKAGTLDATRAIEVADRIADLQAQCDWWFRINEDQYQQAKASIAALIDRLEGET